MDLNDVKAGKYQLVAVRWDQITSKPGQPLDYVRHRRGAIVDLTAEDAKRLVAAGAVVKPGQLEKTKAEQARAVAERAAAEYQAILAGLPDDVRAEVAPNAVPANGRDTGNGGNGGSGNDNSGNGGSDSVPGIKEVLAEVGDDKSKAQVALDAEQAKGEDARSTLVKQLQKIIAS